MTQNVTQPSLSNATLILASQSTIRRCLLERAGVSVRTDTVSVDEREIQTSAQQEGMTLEQCNVLLAEIKARRVSWQHPGAFVLGADQIIECDDIWLSKVLTMDEARDQLKFLRGRKHRSITSVVATVDGERIWHTTGRAVLTMRLLSDQFIETYLNQCGSDILTTVGCYKIEGLGAQLFSAIEGDLFTVMGLPLLPVLDFLRMWKILDT